MKQSARMQNRNATSADDVQIFARKKGHSDIQGTNYPQNVRKNNREGKSMEFKPESLEKTPKGGTNSLFHFKMKRTDSPMQTTPIVDYPVGEV